MNKILNNIILSICLLIAQVLLFNSINFLGYLNPFIYIFFIIYFPLKNNRSFFIFIGFIYGLIIDMFLDTYAIHAAATLTISYLRPNFLKLFFGMAYEHKVVKFNSIETKQNLFYIVSIILIHHLILFVFEVFDISRLSIILKYTFYNGLFSFISIYIMYELLINKRK